MQGVFPSDSMVCKTLPRALPDGLGALDGGPDAGLDVVIVTLVLVLLLAPDQVSVGVLLKLGADQVEGERRQLCV